MLYWGFTRKSGYFSPRWTVKTSRVRQKLQKHWKLRPSHCYHWFIVFSLPRSKQEHPVIQNLHRQHIKSKQRYFHPIYFFISTNKSIWNNFMHRTQLMFRSKRAKINIHFTLEPEHHTPPSTNWSDWRLQCVCVNMSRVMEMYQAGVRIITNHNYLSPAASYGHMTTRWQW